MLHQLNAVVFSRQIAHSSPPFCCTAASMLAPIEHRIALELGARPAQVIAAITLLDEGATVPFIARYRKEVTGGLDDTQLRTLDERLTYLRELEERRVAIVASHRRTRKTHARATCRTVMNGAETKQRLEDLYLPYKQKRRTKAQIAREAGIEPLALKPCWKTRRLKRRSRSREIPQCRCRFCRRQGRTRRRPPDPDGKVARRTPSCSVKLREYPARNTASLQIDRRRRQGNRRRQVPRLLRLLPKPSPACPRTAPWRCFRVAATKACCMSRWSLIQSSTRKPSNPVGHNPCEAAHRRPFRHQADQNRPADKWLADTVRWTWKHQDLHAPRTRADERTARARRGRGDPRIRHAT
jgi:uncharacterized protein